jgi:hypothetical protein
VGAWVQVKGFAVWRKIIDIAQERRQLVTTH